jgi:hypothetical protein
LVVVLALLVAISYGLNAPLSRAANNLWARYEPFLAHFQRDIPHPDDQPHSLGQASFLVVGMGQVGTAAYERIAAQGERPLGLDSDPGQIAKQLEAGRRVIFGDAQDPELWAGLDLKGLEAVVLTVPNTRAKIRATQALRQHGFLGTISALIRQEEPENDLLEVGVSSVCLPLTQAGYELADLSLQKRNEAWDAPRTFRLNLGRQNDAGGVVQPQT